MFLTHCIPEQSLGTLKRAQTIQSAKIYNSPCIASDQNIQDMKIYRNDNPQLGETRSETLKNSTDDGIKREEC